MILLVQIYFYRWIKVPIATDADDSHIGEESALLPESTHERGGQVSTTKAILIRYTTAVCFVVATGTTAWWMSKEGEKPDISKPQEWRVQAMGWSSAILYRAFAFSIMHLC
jgi:hypothetical protein